jgi:RNA polymerase sigma-70 factor, ECF subfamily
MLDNEDKLIKRARKGDSEAFRELYSHHVDAIYRFVLLKVSDRGDAEDLTHDVFLSAWQNVNSYRDRGLPFSSWLYRIARNRVIDHYRTRKIGISIDEVDERLLGVVEHVERDADLAINFAKVVGCFEKLSPDQKDVTILRFIDELSHKEVAQALGKSEGAVRLIQYRALQTLRSLLKDKEPPTKEV